MGKLMGYVGALIAFIVAAILVIPQYVDEKWITPAIIGAIVVFASILGLLGRFKSTPVENYMPEEEEETLEEYNDFIEEEDYCLALFENYKKIIIKPYDIIINYTDWYNNETESRISVSAIQKVYTDGLFSDYSVVGYCSLQKKIKEYPLCGINLMVSLKSGEVIEDIEILLEEAEIIYKEEENPQPNQKQEAVSIGEKHLTEFNNLFSPVRYLALGLSDFSVTAEYWDEKGNLNSQELILNYIIRTDERNFLLLYKEGLKMNALRIDKITKLIIEDEEFSRDQIPEALISYCKKSDEYRKETVIKEFEPYIDLLVYISRAGESLLKKERELILDFISENKPELSLKLLDEELIKWISSFKNTEKTLKDLESGNITPPKGFFYCVDKILEMEQKGEPLDAEIIDLLMYAKNYHKKLMSTPV